MISTSTGEREEDAKEKMLLKTDFKILKDGPHYGSWEEYGHDYYDDEEEK